MRRDNQHLGVLREPLQWRVSTPGTVDSVLRTIREYDHSAVKSLPSGMISTDGLTTIEINPALRKRVAPYLTLAAAHGPQLLQVNRLGRIRMAVTAALRRLGPRDEIPF